MFFEHQIATDQRLILQYFRPGDLERDFRTVYGGTVARAMVLLPDQQQVVFVPLIQSVSPGLVAQPSLHLSPCRGSKTVSWFWNFSHAAAAASSCPEIMWL